MSILPGVYGANVPIIDPTPPSATPGNGPLAGRTSNFDFSLVNFDWITWHDYEWRNWIQVDALLQAAIGFLNLRGIWRPTTSYFAGQTVLDPADTSRYYLCLDDHVSSTDPAQLLDTALWQEKDEAAPPVESVHGRVGPIVAQEGDYAAFYARKEETETHIAQVGNPHGTTWSSLLGKPNFLDRDTGGNVLGRIDMIGADFRTHGDDRGLEMMNGVGDFAEITMSPEGNVRVSLEEGKTFYYGGATPPQTAIFGGTMMSRQMSDDRYMRFLGTWVNTQLFKLNEVVLFEGSTWLCVSTTPTNVQPSNLAPEWVLLASATGGLPAAGEWAIPELQTLVENTGVATYQLPLATGAGLTWTYSLISAPASITFDPVTRTLSFDTDVMERGIIGYTVMAEDQFERAILNEGLVNVTPVVQPLATATDDSIFWTINVPITPYDITQNFTLNGNSGTFGVTGLPTGLSVVADEIVGTPTVASTGDIVITFTDALTREVTSNLTFEVAAAPAIFSDVIWDEASGRLIFDVTQTGTYTWHFGSNSGTFEIVAGANSPTIDLTPYENTTDVFRITKDGQELYVDANLTVPVITPPPTLVTPVILDCRISFQNASVTSILASYPDHEAGDLLIYYGFTDNRKALLGDITVTPLTGDTIVNEFTLDDTELDTSNDQGIAIKSAVATATRSSGTQTVAIGAADQPFGVAVLRIQKDTFKTTAPHMGFLTKMIENAVASVQKTAALTAVQEKGLLIAAFNIPFNAPTASIPAGWSQIPRLEGLSPGDPVDMGATVAWLLARDTDADAAENIPELTFTSSTATPWMSVIGVVMPKGSE